MVRARSAWTLGSPPEEVIRPACHSLPQPAAGVFMLAADGAPIIGRDTPLGELDVQQAAWRTGSKFSVRKRDGPWLFLHEQQLRFVYHVYHVRLCVCVVSETERFEMAKDRETIELVGFEYGYTPKADDGFSGHSFLFPLHVQFVTAAVEFLPIWQQSRAEQSRAGQPPKEPTPTPTGDDNDDNDADADIFDNQRSDDSSRLAPLDTDTHDNHPTQMQQHQQQQTENPSRGSSRLPVNPRRHKVAPEQRKRVATACNSCNVRRIKCSGERPCRQCRGSSRDCVYPAPIEKITISRSELDDLRRRCEAAERALQTKVPDAAERQQLLVQEGGDPTGSRAGSSSSFTPPQSHAQQQQPAQLYRDEAATNDAEAETAGRMLSDPDGRSRFLGETSGATFLDYLKEFMSTVFPLAYNKPWLSPSANNGSTFLASLGRYQTYDSRPIYEMSHVDPLVLPPRHDMTAMLEDLRYFIQDGNGTFPCGGIYWWGDLGSVPVDPNPASFPPGTSRQEMLDKYRHLAFYHTAFAVACQANTMPDHMPKPEDLSQILFSRARGLLGNPLDITNWTISDVAVLALMGFYLIEMNRRDAAYMYVSNAMHISMMHGAHRGWVDERGKRVFWTLYILDRWLSCLMGRPPTIMDDAVRVPLPNDAP
ncbi:fungal specific transcription factor domain-containing protein [Colletotrichum camelliae]|nr:fungal specific transcription factor domain-containing protein [Colletotrichum camelliae]